MLEYFIGAICMISGFNLLCSLLILSAVSNSKQKLKEKKETSDQPQSLIKEN